MARSTRGIVKGKVSLPTETARGRARYLFSSRAAHCGYKHKGMSLYWGITCIRNSHTIRWPNPSHSHTYSVRTHTPTYSTHPLLTPNAPPGAATSRPSSTSLPNTIPTSSSPNWNPPGSAIFSIIRILSARMLPCAVSMPTTNWR